MLRYLKAVDVYGSPVEIIPTQIVAFAQCDDKIQVFVSNNNFFYIENISLEDFEDALRLALRGYYDNSN